MQYTLLTILILLISLLFISCNNTTNSNTTTIAYIQEDTINQRNPHRGFYDASINLEQSYQDNPFINSYNKGYRLVYAPLNLQNYKQKDSLDDTLLQTLQQNLQYAKESGIKLIFRIVYRESIDSLDPSLETILSHLDTLQDIFQQYNDVFSVIQIGTIGAWGEWHSFSGDFNETDPSYLQNRKTVVETLAEIFPNKYLQIRTPMHKEQLISFDNTYGKLTTQGKIDPASLNEKLLQNQIGYHDDCVGSNIDDSGTFLDNNISFWKQYVADDTHYVPMGGESCGIYQEQYSDCSTFLQELKMFHFSYLNDIYHQDVLNKLKKQGCYEIIKNDLGYKLVATSLKITPTDTNITLDLEFINKGYAAPYFDFNTSFIITNVDTNESLTYPIAVEPKKWYPNTLQTLKLTLDKEIFKPQVNYQIALKLANDQNDTIAFANKSLWDETSKTNILTTRIFREK